MIKKSFFVVAAAFLIVIITFFVMHGQISKRTNEVYYDLVAEANRGEFDNFIRYQTLYYQKQESLTLPEYKVDFYLTVDKLEPVITKYLIVLTPLTEIEHAKKANDENDKTRALLTNDKGTISSNDDNYYGNYPISFGLTKNNFYYYSFPVESGNITINLTDYNGNNILDKNITLDIKTSSEDLKTSYVKGFSSQEVTDLLQKDKNYLNIVYVTFGFLTALAVVVGFFYFKKINKEKSQKNETYMKLL